MDERKYYGQWWEPSGLDAKRSGVLTVAVDGRMELELIGGIDLSVRTPLPGGGVAIGIGDRDLPILHGTCENLDITLLDCLNLHSRGGFIEAPSFQRLLAQRAIVGTHLQSRQDDAFRAMTVRLENLTSWVSLPSVVHKAGFEENVSKAEVRLVDPLVVSVNDWEFTAQPSVRGFGFKRYRESDSVVGDATTELRVTPPLATTLGSLDRVVLEFTDLLTLAMGEPCGLISMVVDLLDDEVYRLGDGTEIRRPKTAMILGRRVHTADPEAPAVELRKALFTCSDIAFVDVVPAWLEIRRKAPSACNIFFGISYSRPTYTEMRLLSLAIALETFHRDLYGDVTDLSPARFEQIRETMLAALDDEQERAWVKEKLRNQPSFRERARALAAVPDHAARAFVVSDVEAWAARLVTARNGLAHSAEGGLGLDIFTLSQRTSGLLALLLMARLGLSAEVQYRAAERVLRVFEARGDS
ncbi:MAG TPA: HEPN domain-containing protein [Steroidobacteraceae bacterium]|jgi:hypothetical protein